MNIILKLALVERFPRRAYMLAEKMNVSTALISAFISGIQEPNVKQKRTLAKLLGRKQCELFPNQGVKKRRGSGRPKKNSL